MQRELIIRLLVDSRLDDEELARQFESVYESGTAADALGEGMRLPKNPRLLAVEAQRPASRRFK
jgi:hypothetical protein